jgi:hypothetical protein
MALGASLVPDRAAASEPFAWVIAGNASEGLRLPQLCANYPCTSDPSRPLEWLATSVSPDGSEAIALPDGTLVVTDYRAGMMKLGLDGRLHAWPVRFGPGRPLETLEVDALDATPDGTVLAAISESPPLHTVVRVTPDGVATRLGQVRSETGVHIAALPDGGALVSDGAARVWRAGPDGSVTVAAGTGRRGFSGDEGSAAAARLDGTGALAVMPDGGFLVNDSNNDRVRRVAPNGVISTVFGDGRFRLPGEGSGLRENASAVKVDGSDVNSLHAAPEGGFYLTRVPVLASGAGYLLRVDASGRVRHVPLGTAGPRSADGSFAHAETVDVQADGSLVLVTSNASGYQVRVLAPLERMQRLAVSFTARDRRPVRRRDVEVLATRTARARIELFRGRRVLSAVEVDLQAGLNRVPIPIRRSGEVHMLRVRAADTSGAVAEHRLPLIPGPTLSRRALFRTLAALAYRRSDLDYAVVQRGCRRRSARRFVCRTFEWDGRRYTRRGTGSIRLRADGWLELVERDRRGRHPGSWKLEPQR